MREPLTRQQRAALAKRRDAGDESMFTGFYEGLRVGCAADPSEGTVRIDTWGCGSGSMVELTPDEARREAQALLAAADQAEFGPGQWWKGEWEREKPTRP
jgi:hypothetical protein